MITKRLIDTKLHRIRVKYAEIEALIRENEDLRELDSKMYLSSYVNSRYNERNKVILAEKELLVGIVQDTIKELKALKEKHNASKFKDTKEYREKLQRLVMLSQLNPSALDKVIDHIAEANDVDGLNVLLVDNPTTKEQIASNNKINNCIHNILNDEVTKVLDKTINDFSNGLRGNLLYPTIKMYAEKDMLEGLSDVVPFGAKEMAKFKANPNPSEEECARYLVTKEEYLKRSNGEEYDPRIDENV